jgi:5-methylcytosine-specific restriction protein A
MPTRPPRAKVQRVPGQPVAPSRASARVRGYDTKWQEARAGFLKKHRYCECPAHRGLPTAPLATVVHHKQPHKGDKTLFWQRENWMAMSKPCHDSHTGRHDRPDIRAR